MDGIHRDSIEKTRLNFGSNEFFVCRVVFDFDETSEL